ncbi:MAG: CRISPR-associated helicase/endonuclease Cas3, partial [Candidatus Kryptonium sp.]
IENEFKNPKSNDVEEGKILVATQVVEASLDIDADVLFTEICPLDALVQRMGRVLRRIGPNFVFEGGNGSIRVYKDTLNRKDKEYEIDLSEPNVYLIIFRNGLESGNGRVYHKELIRLSIAWLWRYSKGDIRLYFDEDNKIYDNFREIFASFQNENETSKSGKSKKKQKQDEEEISIIQNITGDDEWIRSIKIQDFSMSEYGKYKIVKLFYKLLDKNGEYLSEFYKTLEVLEAGYVPDRKEEAQSIFRKVFDVNIIPQNRLDDFIKELKNFPKNKKSTEKYLHSDFKANVLSKFIVSVPYGRYAKDLVPAFVMVEGMIENIDENLKGKLKVWLSDVYVGKLSYDEELGVIVDDKSEIWVNERII